VGLDLDLDNRFKLFHSFLSHGTLLDELGYLAFDQSFDLRPRSFKLALDLFHQHVF
jgi:hypothetical protein